MMVGLICLSRSVLNGVLGCVHVIGVSGGIGGVG